ncbi:MAG: hypothetical protein KDE47_14960, partial [Caldilineaceae bacterium]|nr:hypothetical protein [Caldilineaceae bacterium]
MKRFSTWTALVLLLAVTLSGCAMPAPTPGAESDGQDATEIKDFVTWYQYDQNNEDPASDERVGNEYLRDTVPLFNEAFAGKWNWVNQPKAWDQMAAELVAAVQAGGDVPDLFHTGSGNVTLFYKNGV